MYATLERLESKRYLESWLGEPVAERGGRPRRYYRVRPAGARALEDSWNALRRMWQGLEPPATGPEFFVIDFTEDKETALALCRRLRELGLAAARDIMSRPLPESLAYARDIRAARAVVIDPAGVARAEVRVVDPASGHETAVPLSTLMAAPGRVLEPLPRGALA